MNEDIRLFSERRKVSGDKLLPTKLQGTNLDQETNVKKLDSIKLR